MSEKLRKTTFWITILILAGLGIWHISNGLPGFGTGLIGGAIGVTAGRLIRQKKIRELQNKGLNPYDERTYVIAGKASYATIISGVLISGLFILLGSTFGPTVSVNPYNFLGYCLSIIVLIYIFFYYYYNRIM